MNRIYLTAMFATYIIALIMSNNHVKPRKVYKITAFIIFIILLCISGFRSTSSIGDTYFYSHTYDLLVRNPKMQLDSKEFGFNLLMLLLTKISANPQILIIFTAFVTNAFIILTLYKYSEPFEMGIFLYFGTICFYVTMNGIRQSMVAAILFWAAGYLIRKDWLKYFAIILVLSAFHSSALIFIPIYFICNKIQVWSRSFFIMLGIVLVMLVAFRPLIGVFSNFLSTTSYSEYGQDMLQNTTTVNPIRVMVTFVPLVLAFIVRDKIKEEWKEGNIFIYMSLFNFIFMLFGTQYLFFYRLCMYFELFNLVLIPKLLSFYDKKSQRVLYLGIILFYTVFTWYQVTYAWSDTYKNVLFSKFF